MQTLKKVFSSFVSMTTILWSVGGTLAFPNVASAAVSGDLIKASGPAVYYYASNGKRYVFPNEKTYFTWYSNFSSVKTITDAELAAIMIGGNVTYRPGVKMVKITTDPKVYAVAKGGTLRHVPSESCATTLYGSSWSSMVEDVPDGFFVNYTVGNAINASCSDFDKAAEMSGSPTINDSLGTSSTPASGSVSVALAADTPAGVTVPQGASSVSLLKINVTAGSEAGLVTGLTIHRVGVGSSTDFSNVYLYDGSGTRLTTGRTINSQTQNVQFNSLNITVPANSTKSFVLVGDISTSLTAGSQHAFEVMDAAALTLSGSAAVSGSFPVRGNTFTIGSTAASELDVLKGSAPSNPNVGAQDVEVSNFKLTANTNDIEIRRITLLQAGDISNTDLTDLKLWQGSTMVASTPSLVGDKIVLNFSPAFVVQNGQTKTFSLTADVAGRSSRTIRTYVEYTTDVYAVDVRYGTGAMVDIDDSAGFDGTSASKYIEVTTQGGTLTLATNGPAAGNVAKGSQDVKLFKFAMTSAESQLEIRRLRFAIESADSEGGLLEEGTTDYFTDLKVIDTDTGTVVMGPTSLPATATSGTTLTFTDSFFLQPGQTKNLAFTADLANSTDSNFVDEEFHVCLTDNTDSDTIAAGSDTTLCGDSADAIFQLGDVKIVETGENLALAKIVPNAPISGNNQTVRSSALSVALASSPSASTAVKKQANIPAVGFVFTAGNESNVLVRSVTVTGTGDSDSGNTSLEVDDLIDVVTSCALFDGNTQIGTAQSPDATEGTMNFTNLNFTINAGASKTITAKCTADSVVDGTDDRFALGIGSTDVTAEDADNNEITETVSAAVSTNAGASASLIQTVKSSGSLSVTAGSHPQSTIVVGGAAKKFAEFTATAQYEDVTVDRITVTSTNAAANFSGISVRVAGAEKGADILPNGNDRFKDVALTTPVTVPKDGSVTFELWGTMANTVSSSTVAGSTNAPRSGNTVELGLGVGNTASPWDSNYTTSIFNVMAVGSASGDRLYASGSATTGNGANAMTLRKTKPTITKLAVATNALTSGSDTELYKFQITPDAAGSVAWKQLVFTIATSSVAIALDNFKLFKGSTQLTANTEVVITNVNGVDISGSTDLAGTTVIVYLVNEEVVSGSGTVYTLRATPTYSGSSATVSTSFTRSTTAATGYLALAAGAFQWGIDTSSNGPDGTSDVTSNFIWSDNSEVPHNFTSSTSAASRDWTNDLYVEDMTQSQTLTQ